MKKTTISKLPPLSPSRQPAHKPREKLSLSKSRRNGHAEGEMDGEQLLAALMGLKKGDFNIRLPLGWTGLAGKVADTFNEVAELMEQSTEDLSRISRVVGREGRIQERLPIGHVTGHWEERVNSVNTLIECLAH